MTSLGCQPTGYTGAVRLRQSEYIFGSQPATHSQAEQNPPESKARDAAGTAGIPADEAWPSRWGRRSPSSGSPPSAAPSARPPTTAASSAPRRRCARSPSRGCAWSTSTSPTCRCSTPTSRRPTAGSRPPSKPSATKSAALTAPLRLARVQLLHRKTTTPRRTSRWRAIAAAAPLHALDRSQPPGGWEVAGQRSRRTCTHHRRGRRTAHHHHLRSNHNPDPPPHRIRPGASAPRRSEDPQVSKAQMLRCRAPPSSAAEGDEHLHKTLLRRRHHLHDDAGNLPNTP